MELPVPQIIISVLLLRVVNQVHPYTHLVMNAEVVMQTILSATRNSFIDGQSVRNWGSRRLEPQLSPAAHQIKSKLLQRSE
jgi:hypothetical protein